MAIMVDGQVEYAGRVLDVGCRVDSLFESDEYFAVVLGEDGREERVTTGVRPWMMAPGGYSVNEAAIDATAEVIAAARASAVAELTRAAAYASAKAAAEVVTGKRVRVAKGRKVAVGTEGECFWLGETQYGRRAGIRDDQGQVHWTAYDNVEVAEPLDHVGDWAAFVASAEAHARQLYGKAEAALEERRAAGTGEFFVEPFRAAMAEAIERAAIDDTASPEELAETAPFRTAMLRAQTTRRCWCNEDAECVNDGPDEPMLMGTPDDIDDQAAGTVVDGLASALKVLVLDPKIRRFLQMYDPMALAQACHALNAAGHPCQTTEEV